MVFSGSVIYAVQKIFLVVAASWAISHCINTQIGVCVEEEDKNVQSRWLGIAG